MMSVTNGTKQAFFPYSLLFAKTPPHGFHRLKALVIRVTTHAKHILEDSTEQQRAARVPVAKKKHCRIACTKSATLEGAVFGVYKA
jgi:hypothetical protein